MAEKNIILLSGGIVVTEVSWRATFKALAKEMKKLGVGDFVPWAKTFRTEGAAYNGMSMLHLRLEEMGIEYYYESCLEPPED